MPETDGETKVNDFCEKVELQNVSFIYPGAKEESLIDVNLTINKGETVAIVGHNGAGKSILVRLSTGIYQPNPAAPAFWFWVIQ